MTKLFIITAADLVCLVILNIGLVIEGYKKTKATQAKLDEALQAATEAKNLLLQCESKIIDLQRQAAKARQLEAQTVRDMEKKRDVFNQEFDIILTDMDALSAWKICTLEIDRLLKFYEELEK